MARVQVASFTVAALALIGSGWVISPEAGAPGIRGSPAEASDADPACDPCAAVVDDAPNRDHFENMLAVSPLDPTHVVTASMYSLDGGAMQVSVFVSRDGARTWSKTELPYSERAPVDHPMRLVNGVVDPAIAIASDGTVLVAGSGFTNVGARSAQLPMADTLFVATSTDGGATFPVENVRIIQQSLVAYQDYSDMPRFATGPDGLAILGWGSVDLPSPGSVPRFVETLNVNLAGSIEGRFSVSRDAGRTWSEPRVAFRDTDTLYYPAHPVILADGSWAMMPSDNQDLSGGRVYFVRSTDEGATWSWEATGLRGLLQGVLAASRADGKLYYSFLIPTGNLAWVTPAVAVADGPGQPWRTIPLTNAPVRRNIIENTIAVDATGTARVIYVTQSASDPVAQIRIASIAPDGTLSSVPMDTVKNLGVHYFGLDATPNGAIATWDAGEAPYALHAGAVTG